MPKIPMPGRQVIPSGRAGAERMPAYPQPARRMGQQTQRFGQTLQRLGGQFADIAARLDRIQVTNETQRGELDYEEVYTTKVDEIRQQFDFLDWEVEFYKWHDQKAPELVKAAKSPRGKEFLALKFEEERQSRGVAIAAEARKLYVRDTLVGWDAWSDMKASEYANARSDEQRSRITDQYLAQARDMDENIAEVGPKWVYAQKVAWLEQAEKLRLTREYNQAVAFALEVVDREGLEPALALVAGMQHLTPSQRRSVSGEVKWADKFKEVREDEAATQKAAEDIGSYMDTLLRSLTNPAEKIDRGEVEGNLNLGLDRERMLAVANGQNKPEPKDTQYIAKGKRKDFGYTKLEDKVFQAWAGEITKGGAQIAIAQGRWVHRTLTNADTSELLERLKLTVPRDLQDHLRGSFGYVRGRTDAKAASAANTTLLYWVLEQAARKKMLSQEDIVNKARSLSAPTSPMPSGIAPPLPNRTWYERNPWAVQRGIDALEEAGIDAPDWMLELQKQPKRIRIRNRKTGEMGTVPEDERQSVLDSEEWEVVD